MSIAARAGAGKGENMRKRILIASSILFAAIAAQPVAAGVVASWTYDTGEQGWNPTFPSNTGTATEYQSSGGNPGGFLEATDRSGGFQAAGPWYFELNQIAQD